MLFWMRVPANAPVKRLVPALRVAYAIKDTLFPTGPAVARRRENWLRHGGKVLGGLMMFGVVVASMPIVWYPMIRSQEYS